MAKLPLPAGPVNIHKSLAAGSSLPAAVAKATTVPATTKKR